MLLFDYKIPVEADRALRDAYVALAFAFRRLEGSARSRDTELCSTLLKVRAEIERVLKAQDAAPAEALAAPSASQEALREALAEKERRLARYENWHPMSVIPESVHLQDGALLHFYSVDEDGEETWLTATWDERPDDALAWCTIVSPLGPDAKFIAALAQSAAAGGE